MVVSCFVIYGSHHSYFAYGNSRGSGSTLPDWRARGSATAKVNHVFVLRLLNRRALYLHPKPLAQEN